MRSGPASRPNPSWIFPVIDSAASRTCFAFGGRLLSRRLISSTTIRAASSTRSPGFIDMRHDMEASRIAITNSTRVRPKTPPADLSPVVTHAVRARPQSTPSEHAVRARRQSTPSEHALRARPQSTPSEHALRARPQSTPSEHALRARRQTRRQTRRQSTPSEHAVRARPQSTPSEHPTTHARNDLVTPAKPPEVLLRRSSRYIRI